MLEKIMFLIVMAICSLAINVLARMLSEKAGMTKASQESNGLLAALAFSAYAYHLWQLLP